MGKAKTIITCPLCKEKTQAGFIAPTVLKPSYIRLTCSGCEAEFSVWLKRTPGEPASKLKIDIMLEKPSRETREAKEANALLPID